MLELISGGDRLRNLETNSGRSNGVRRTEAIPRRLGPYAAEHHSLEAPAAPSASCALAGQLVPGLANKLRSRHTLGKAGGPGASFSSSEREGLLLLPLRLTRDP